MFADGLEDAFLGIGQQFHRHVAVYDLDAVLELLCRRDGMTHEDAQEHIEFNILGAWVGPGTPIFVKRVSLSQAKEIAVHLDD